MKSESNHINQNILWNDDASERFNNDTYNNLLINQYKLYSEIADRTHIRRIVINIFFIVIHAGILGVLGLSLSRQPFVPNIILLLFPLLGLLVLCYAWARLSQYFRRLCRAKDLIIKAMEKRLPSAVFATEQAAVISPKPYNPLRKIELYLPFIFGLLYIFSFCYVWYLSVVI